MFQNGQSTTLGYESLFLNNRPSLYFANGGVLGRGALGLVHVAAAAKPPANLYAGKWTLEEERFVTFLCEEFRSGSLDIPEGKSLRCYLAEQLGCNAKRISKKYERTGYNGKLQYVDKRSSLPVEERAKRQAQLQELDRKFRESRETLKIVEASRKRTACGAMTAGTATSTAAFGGLGLGALGGGGLGSSGILAPQAVTVGPASALGVGLGGLGEPSLKRQRTDLLASTSAASATAAGVNSNLRLAALQGSSLCGGGSDPMGQLQVLGAAPAAAAAAAPLPSGPTTMMESMLLRRSMLATRSASLLGQDQSNNDLVRASMLSALQKYGGTTSAATTLMPRSSSLTAADANATTAAAFAAAAAATSSTTTAMDPPTTTTATTATTATASSPPSRQAALLPLAERAVSPSAAAGLLAMQKRASLSSHTTTSGSGI